MEIYNSRYFEINKKLLSCNGIWPYDEKKKKYITRFYYSVIIITTLMPQVFGFYKEFGVNVDQLLEHLGTIFFTNVIYLKLTTSAYCEEKLKVLFNSIAKNWQTITDKNERNILIAYSERGRMLTIGYITYMILALIVYTALPMIPIILNIVMPLNESRPRIFILNGEFFVNKHDYYVQIYIFDCLGCSVATSVVIAVDTTYAVCTEHCLGLFAIIKYRLRENYKLAVNKNECTKDDASYNRMVHTIRLHSDILKFANILEASYSLSFLIIMGVNMIYFSVLSVLVLISLDKPLNFIRYSMLSVALLIHLFYLSWPGQKLIDHSGGLFRDAYTNEWYEDSTRSKNLLRFFTLRCSEPCLLTAGGLYTLNFENFLSILKKSLSYITVFSSFR